MLGSGLRRARGQGNGEGSVISDSNLGASLGSGGRSGGSGGDGGGGLAAATLDGKRVGVLEGGAILVEELKTVDGVGADEVGGDGPGVLSSVVLDTSCEELVSIKMAKCSSGIKHTGDGAERNLGALGGTTNEENVDSADVEGSLDLPGDLDSVTNLEVVTAGGGEDGVEVGVGGLGHGRGSEGHEGRGGSEETHFDYS